MIQPSSAKRAPKKIVILFDGTSNEIEEDRTNILRLYGCLTKSDTQLVYYDPGVGTLGARSWLKLKHQADELLGMATGWGLATNVKEAYRFLVENYDKAAGDQIYLFGYSRGAYTARVLAGFLHEFGLLERRNLNLLDYVYRAYERIGENGAQDAFAEIGLHYRVIRPDLVQIRCLGLFDTVASIIELVGLVPHLRQHAGTVNNGSVESVRHAVALEESRKMFRPQLWGPDQDYTRTRFKTGDSLPQDVKEVWFAGSHGDVGGGLPEAQSGLAKIPLIWMIEETARLGLEFKTRTVNEIVLGQNPKKHYVPPDPLSASQNSMTLGWRLFARLFGSGRRAVPDGAILHHSVLDRDPRPDTLPQTYRVLRPDGTVQAAIGGSAEVAPPKVTGRPMDEPKPIPEQVQAAFACFPQAERARLLDMRKLIFDEAARDPRLGALSESLKWGQPSYAPAKPKVGTPLRLALARDGTPGMFVHCQTDVIETVRPLFPTETHFDGTRAVLLPMAQPLPEDALRAMIRTALGYHLL